MQRAAVGIDGCATCRGQVHEITGAHIDRIVRSELRADFGIEVQVLGSSEGRLETYQPLCAAQLHHEQVVIIKVHRGLHATGGSRMRDAVTA